MTYKDVMAKKKQEDVVDEILEEIRSEGDMKPTEKRAYYADFPKGLYGEFEEAIKPWKPTRAFVRFMQKIVERSKKK